MKAKRSETREKRIVQMIDMNFESRSGLHNIFRTKYKHICSILTLTHHIKYVSNK
ncbi:MAG: YdeI/OmpD-associated family protein [Caldicoprobacteraceae bacterium]